MKQIKFFLVVGLALCGLVLALSATHNAAAASHIVNNNGDGGDATPGNGVCETGTGNGICTLRAAIEETNAATGPDTITFDSSIGMVAPNSQLPALDDASGGTTIKGNPTWLFGSFAGSEVDGFILNSDDNKIQGMYITNFDGNGVVVYGHNNTIGTDGDGVDDDTESNVISSNGEHGVNIENDATGNWLAGNLIGLTFDGTGDAGNGLNGVQIDSGAEANLIGTDGDGTSDVLERNVISGNDDLNGVRIFDASDNVVAGNYIGTNAAGNLAIPNAASGVAITSHCVDNLIGTDGDGVADAQEGNLISGNGGSGIFLGSNTTHTTVAGNSVGINAAGDAALPNDDGVMIYISANNLIGTDGDGVSDELEGNVISGNASVGVTLVWTATHNIIAGNYIGINPAGDIAIPNDSYGIYMSQASTDNLIGTDGDGLSDDLERNVISGNSSHGIYIQNSDSYVIAGNYIGTNAAGDAALANGGIGTKIQDSNSGRIGGTLVAERNVISGNGNDGVTLSSVLASQVLGNYIGTDASGEGSLGNELRGVNIGSASVGITVGGTSSGAANRIAYNGGAGIRVYNVSYDNSLRGNLVFANGELGIDLAPEYGVTPNDPGDGDEGGNHLQNFPVLASAVSYGTQTVVTGALNSTASTTFALDFYANSNCDSSGYGEGEIYLGAATVTTDGSGNASFMTSSPISVTVGYSLTATATDPDGNTSEFSLCQEVVAPPPESLSVYLDGTGTGTVSSDPAGISCPGDCDELYDYGTQVTLAASADSGSIFAGWSGVCSGTGTCTVMMTETQSVTATFDLLPPGQYALTVNLAGAGEGTVSGSGIDCFSGPGADCTEAFTGGTVVTLTASAEAVSIFTGWSGDCSGTDDCVLTMTESQTVTATFGLEAVEYKNFLPLIIR